MSASNEQLIRKAQGGDREAWQQLLTPLQQPVMGFLRQSLASADAADVAQMTFVQVLRKVKQCRQPERFKSWVLRIAYRQMLNFIQKRGRSAWVSSDQSERLNEAPDPATVDGRHGLQASCGDLYHGIQKLSEDLRQVVWLRLKEGLTFRQIAEITQAPLGTVLGRMHQAKCELKLHLTQPTIEPLPAKK